MPVIDENDLSKLLSRDVNLRLVEPHVYSVYSDFDGKSSYDSRFGSLYDRVACSPLYNRIMWGYSTADYATRTLNALESSDKGWVLDVGCGSLAFTSKTYLKYCKRPVVLLDQSIKLIRMAKARLIKMNGEVPSNMVFINGDALNLPFIIETFQTVVSLNLIHVIQDLQGLLSGINDVLVKGGMILFSTLVKGNNIRNRYLEMWEKKGELVSRDIDRICSVFDELGMPVKYEIKGSLAFIGFGGDSVFSGP